MNLAQELERLAKLQAEGLLTADEFTKAKSQVLSAQRFSGLPFKGIRRQSSRKLCGLRFGLSRSVRIGSSARCAVTRGWFACGGLARGIFAVGGLAIGLFALGGGAIGVLVALGGGAVGGVALGGGAIGLIAIGGGACGYYACGSGAVGVHTVSALHQDPEAVSFFRQYFPWLTQLLHQ